MICTKCGKHTDILYCNESEYSDGICPHCHNNAVTKVVAIFFAALIVMGIGTLMMLAASV